MSLLSISSPSGKGVPSTAAFAVSLGLALAAASTDADAACAELLSDELIKACSEDLLMWIRVYCCCSSVDGFLPGKIELERLAGEQVVDCSEWNER